MRLKFQFTASAASDDLFIDDINVTGVVGVQEVNGIPVLQVVPNPANEAFDLVMAAEGDVDIRILAADGRSIWHMSRTDAANGLRLRLNKAELGGASGLYLVQVATARGTSTQRLIVE